MKCKHCRHWTRPEKHRTGNFFIGICTVEPADVSRMRADTAAINCSHDGYVMRGENFGCVHFKEGEPGWWDAFSLTFEILKKSSNKPPQKLAEEILSGIASVIKKNGGKTTK